MSLSFALAPTRGTALSLELTGERAAYPDDIDDMSGGGLGVCHGAVVLEPVKYRA